MSSTTPSAREGALAKLAAEAARFEQPAPQTIGEVSTTETPERPRLRPAPEPNRVVSAPATARAARGAYVPVAVAPERGNTRPVVPVDGRLHMRVAKETLTDIDAIVRSWKDRAPQELRDLERATLVRIGLAMVLADITQSGDRGAVGEAVRAALDPQVRHTAVPMPDLARWIRRSAED